MSYVDSKFELIRGCKTNPALDSSFDIYKRVWINCIFCARARIHILLSLKSLDSTVATVRSTQVDERKLYSTLRFMQDVILWFMLRKNINICSKEATRG